MASGTMHTELVNQPIVSALSNLGDYTGHYTYSINKCYKIGKLCFVYYDCRLTDGVRFTTGATIGRVPENMFPSTPKQIMAMIRLTDEKTVMAYPVDVSTNGYISQSATNTCSGVGICGCYVLD